MTRSLALGLLAALLAPAGAAMAQDVLDRFEGLYRPIGPDLASWTCTDIGTAGGAVGFAGTALIGVRTRCELSNPVRIRGMDAFLFDAQCRSDGHDYQDRIMLMESREGVYVIRDGDVSEWQACPR